MKKILTLVLCSFAALGLSAREVNTIKNWQFRLQQEENWRDVITPHDFQMELPWQEEMGSWRGYKASETGIYKHTFSAKEDWKGQKVYLDLEGVAMQAEISVNGKIVGEIDYGYLGTEIDITDHIKYDSDNEIIVSAYPGHLKGSRWYTGGGIYRNVHIIVKNPKNITRQGLYITTPLVSEEKAEVKVQVEIEGFTNNREDIEIVADIYGPDGKKVAQTSAPAPKRDNLEYIEVALPIIELVSPQLWSCEAPHLYKAVVSLVKDGEVIDCDEQTFGVRTIEFDKAFGFKLNGKKVFLKGVSNHHDLGALGAAAYPEAEERLILKLKEFGFNHIRCSHNPYSSSFLDLCDKHGILVVDELYDKWMTQDNTYWIAKYPFTQSWFNHVREWIKRDRNHPSVIAWSFGNETQINEPWTGFPRTGDWGVTTYKVMKTLAERYDDTRDFTVAQFPSRWGSIYKTDDRFNKEEYVRAPELASATDFASLNYRFRDYDLYLQHDPDLNIYQSEASTSELAAPYFGMRHDTMIGLAYWGAVEYWGESDGWPKKGWNYSFFNNALEAYPQAYLIKSAFSDEPVVRIGVVCGEKQSIDWNMQVSGKTPMNENWNLPKGSTQELYTFTNADEVELIVNGRSLGIKKNQRDDIDRRNVIQWQNVPYGNGGKVVAIARTAGKEVARHSIETTGKVKGFKVVQEDLGGELSYVKFYAVDQKGRPVKTADNSVKFDLLGDAQIVAIDNVDHYTDELFDVNPKKMHNGFVMVIVRKGSEKAILRASADGIKSAVAEIDKK